MNREDWRGFYRWLETARLEVQEALKTNRIGRIALNTKRTILGWVSTRPTSFIKSLASSFSASFLMQMAWDNLIF